MWVYIESEPGLYTVGFYKPDGTWVSESDHAEKSDARDRVNYLNGGMPPNPDVTISGRINAECLNT